MMGGGFFGSGAKSTTSTATTHVTNQSQGVEDGGMAVSSSFNLGNVGGGKNSTTNLSVIQTDHGAVEGALSSMLESLTGAFSFGSGVADGAFGFGGDIFDAATDIATESIYSSNAAAESAFGISRDVMDNTGAIIGDTMELAKDTQQGTWDFTRDLFADAFGAVSSVLSEGQAQLGNVVTNLNAISRENSKSSDERIATMAKQVLIAGGVLLGLAVVAVVWKANK